MNPASVDIKDILVTAGVGTFAATSGWAIYISREPSEPDTCITIYDTGGPGANPKWLIEEPSIQVRVRGAKLGYLAAYQKADAVKQALLGRAKQTVNSTVYVSFTMLSEIAHIGYDENSRPLFTINFNIIREPSSGTHRTAL